MPFELSWEDPCGVLATYYGRISEADLEQICEQVTVHPRWASLRYVIVDALSIHGVDVDSSTSTTLARPNVLLIGASYSHDPVLFAIATRNDELLHMLQRQWDLHAFPYATEVFESLELARARVDRATGRHATY